MLARRLLPWLIPTLLPAQVAIADLPAIARARAERARPAQEKALEPFWADLALEYRTNQQFLDTRIAQAAALGDSVVPLLLEKLSPNEGWDAARQLASNCRRVLEQLDPTSFAEALVELAAGTNEIARTEAIRLLAAVDTQASVQVLTDLVQRTTGDERRLVLRSLRLLRTPAAAPHVVGLLGSPDRQVREDVLDYLAASRAASVADTVVQALAAETVPQVLPRYVEYFGAAVRGHDAAARTLIPLLDRERLDWQDTRRLVQILATVAPKEHEPTCRRLHELIDTGETSSLTVAAAVTLRHLGDRHGVTKLQRIIGDQLRRKERKKESSLYEQRANLNFAIEDYEEAIADYERILEFTEGLAMTRRAYEGLIRCEARRRKWTNLIKHMKSSGLMVGEIEALAADDPALQEALQNDKVRSFLQALAKEQAPK